MRPNSASTGKLQLRKNGTVTCPSCKAVLSPDLTANLLPKHDDIRLGHLCLESNREFIFNPWTPPKRKKRDNRLDLLKAPDSVLTDEERAMKKRILANVEKYKIRDPETRRYEYEQNQAKRDPEKRAAIRRAEARERIRELMNRYTNQQLTSAEVVAELIELSKKIVAESNRGEQFSPPLSNDELAFYDMMATNGSAGEVLEDDVLAQIARDLVSTLRRDAKTDWTVRDDVRAKLRRSIKTLLRKHKYPPEQRNEAVVLVLEQMERFAPRWSEAA